MCSNLLWGDHIFNHDTAGESAPQRQLKSYDTGVRMSPIYSVRRQKASSDLIRRGGGDGGGD